MLYIAKKRLSVSLKNSTSKNMSANFSHILKDAKTLRQTAAQKEQINAAITETLTYIGDLIDQAHENGIGYVETHLPMQFSIDGMTFQKMQQHVWCGIINELKKKNYRVSIDPTDSECALYIVWESEEEKKCADEQTRMLASHMVRR